MEITYSTKELSETVNMAYCFGNCCVDVNGGSSGKNGDN